MTLYLGNKPVGLCKIVEKEIAKTKFGATVDSFLGDVDADGNYVAPTEPFEVNLAGVKSVSANAFAYRFAYCGGITSLLANDVTFVKNSAFSNCISFPTTGAKPVRVEFNSLEEVSNGSAFSYFAQDRGTNGTPTFSFPKLKKVSGTGAFSNMASRSSIDVAYTFPVLEEISGNQPFNSFCDAGESNLYFAKVKKITGDSKYYATFGSLYVNGTKWYFPSATEMTGYIWNVGSSYTGEIHFAAANREAIEACEGYDYKWGFAGATIFWDL